MACRVNANAIQILLVEELHSRASVAVESRQFAMPVTASGTEGGREGANDVDVGDEPYESDETGEKAIDASLLEACEPAEAALAVAAPPPPSVVVFHQLSRQMNLNCCPLCSVSETLFHFLRLLPQLLVSHLSTASYPCSQARSRVRWDRARMPSVSTWKEASEGL